LASSLRSERARAFCCLALPALLWAAATAGAAEPPLEVTDAEGTRVQLGLRKGETALIVHFWASWCPECVVELPAVGRVAARCAGVVNVVAVNVAESLEAAQAFRSRHGSTLPLLRDAEGRLWRRFARALPANLIVTRDGESVTIGPHDDEAWEQRTRQFGCPPANSP
jgi:thiol-disulfide isomerase/thioredoxin